MRDCSGIHLRRASLSNAYLSAFWAGVGLISLMLWASSCSRPTEDPGSKVVQLREKLRSLARGDITEIIGRTEPEEAYVLLSGYPERPLESLSLSNRLRSRLKRISPHRSTEVYVLARVQQDDIIEYTQWRYGGADWHPVLTPTPHIIRGNPFKISRGLDEYTALLIVENLEGQEIEK